MLPNVLISIISRTMHEAGIKTNSTYQSYVALTKILRMLQYLEFKRDIQSWCEAKKK